ncbi:MAG: WYL domain-containing protein [Candidatus Heimdallarchaeota archaeon]
MNSQICDAISNKQVLEFSYDGHFRKVEPHTLGVSTKGNDLLAAYQVSGGSKKGKIPDWKQFNLDKIESLNVLEETFDAPRPGYVKGDSRMTRIYCEL